MTYQANRFHPFEGLSEVCTASNGGPWVEVFPVYGKPVTLTRVSRWRIKSVILFPAAPDAAPIPF